MGQTAAQGGQQGRYVVVFSPHGARDTFLLDTVTGKTWQLRADGSRGGAPVWSPMARADNAQEVQTWERRNPKGQQAQPVQERDGT